MPTFYIRVPVGVNQMELTRAIREAIVEATKTGKLRPNSVDSLTGENSGDNLGEGVPVIHYEQWEKDEIEVRLILKGGGCENKNIQYSLPVNWRGWVVPVGTWMGFASASCTASTKLKGRDAAPDSSEWASAVTVPPVMSWPKSSCSGKQMIPTPILIWPAWKTTSWIRPTN